jgi:hypothetical protein
MRLRSSSRVRCVSPSTWGRAGAAVSFGVRAGVLAAGARGGSKQVTFLAFLIGTLE